MRRAALGLAALLSLAACGGEDRVPLREEPPHESSEAPPVSPAEPAMEAPTPAAPATSAEEKDPAKAAIGLWESTSVAKTGIGSAIELREGGVALAGAALMTDGGKWRYEAGKLEVTGERDEYRNLLGDTTYDVEWKGQDMRLKAKGVDRTLHRVAMGPPEEPIVCGVWASEHSSGRKAFTRYAPGGRIVTRVPMLVRRGTWAVENGAVVTTISLHGEVAAPIAWKLSGDRLSREPSSKHDVLVEYRRLEGGPWWPLLLGAPGQEKTAPVPGDNAGREGDGAPPPPMGEPEEGK